MYSQARQGEVEFFICPKQDHIPDETNSRSTSRVYKKNKKKPAIYISISELSVCAFYNFCLKSSTFFQRDTHLGIIAPNYPTNQHTLIFDLIVIYKTICHARLCQKCLHNCAFVPGASSSRFSISINSASKQQHHLLLFLSSNSVSIRIKPNQLKR